MTPSDSVLVMALHNLTDLNVPLGVKILGAYGLCQVRRPEVLHGRRTVHRQLDRDHRHRNVRKIEGIACAVAKGYVLHVDTTAEEAEVLV